MAILYVLSGRRVTAVQAPGHEILNNSGIVKKKVNILFFLFGLGAFTYLVWHFGLDQIALNMRKAGWNLLLVVVVWLFIYILNTIAWKIILVRQIPGLAIPRLFSIKVAGFTINTLTPFLAVGGEPYQVKVLGNLIGPARSVSAVVVYRMIHLLGHMSFLFCGCLWALAEIRLPGSLVAVLSAAAAVIGGIIFVTLSGHRFGIFVHLGRWMGKAQWSKRLWSRFVDESMSPLELDDVITRAYAKHRVRFYTAVGCEFLSRVLMGVEVYIILHGIGIAIALPMAIFLYALYSLVINFLFFIPLNLGVREGGLILGMEALALPPLIGVYLGVVIRLREFVWILFGLLLMVVNMSFRETAVGEPAGGDRGKG